MPRPELTLISRRPSFLGLLISSSESVALDGFLPGLTKFLVPLKNVTGESWRMKAVVIKIKTIYKNMTTPWSRTLVMTELSQEPTMPPFSQMAVIPATQRSIRIEAR